MSKIYALFNPISANKLGEQKAHELIRFFPDEDIIIFMNLPYENTEAYAARCVWQDIEEVKLLEDTSASELIDDYKL